MQPRTTAPPPATSATDASLLDLLECTLCLRLLCRPITTTCGHTFCKKCLIASLAHSNRCPICRGVLPMHSSHESLAVNVTMDKCIERLFPDVRMLQIEEEKAAEKAKSNIELTSLPVFVLDALLPRQTMTLNVYEPRYLLMVERCLQGGKRFGMMGYFRSHHHHGHHGQLAEHGTEAEIIEAERTSDGRYIVKIVGRRSFKVDERWSTDGYVMARVNYIDLSLPPSVALEETLSAAVTLRSKISEWEALVRSGGWERHSGQLNTILEQLGPIPADSTPDDLALWVGALINPLPGLGVAPEIRPHLLAADSSNVRVMIAVSAITSSIRYLQPGRLNKILASAGFKVNPKVLRNVTAAVPWLIIVIAILIRVCFYSDDPAVDAVEGGGGDGVLVGAESIHQSPFMEL